MSVSQDLKNLNHIFDDHVGSDMAKEEFRQLCKTAWEKQHWFVIIDLSSKNTTVSIEVILMSFTYQIKLKIKTIIIFSLQRENNAVSVYTVKNCCILDQQAVKDLKL